MDLLFARLALAMIPDNLNVDDDNVLRNLDEKSILSLNGAYFICLQACNTQCLCRLLQAVVL